MVEHPDEHEHVKSVKYQTDKCVFMREHNDEQDQSLSNPPYVVGGWGGEHEQGNEHNG